LFCFFYFTSLLSLIQFKRKEKSFNRMDFFFSFSFLIHIYYHEGIFNYYSEFHFEYKIKSNHQFFCCIWFFLFSNKVYLIHSFKFRFNNNDNRAVILAETSKFIHYYCCCCCCYSENSITIIIIIIIVYKRLKDWRWSDYFYFYVQVIVIIKKERKKEGEREREKEKK
jgi:hypothetical protein